MWIVGEQQDLRGRRQHEQHADQRLLHFRPLALGPGQQQRGQQRRAYRRDLGHPALQFQPKIMRGDHADTGHLRDGEVDEDDTAGQHLLTERHMRGQHDQAGKQRRPQDAEILGQ